jgi:hypothetical protein
MGMVFCRGCGREIHESAPVCPLCGAPQAVPPALRSRSLGKLIGWAFVWTSVFWVGSLFVAGFVAGYLNPQDAHAAGARVGQLLGVPLFFGALCVAVGLTAIGKLPGTKKPTSLLGPSA